MAQRLKTGSDVRGKQNVIQRQVSAVPEDYIPRGSPARAASQYKLDHNVVIPTGRCPRNRPGALPALQLGELAFTFVKSKICTTGLE